MAKLRWGIIGTGHIANTFAAAARSHKGELAAVASRTKTKARDFASARYQIANAHASYEALLADPTVEAVYIATPHPMHAEWCHPGRQGRQTHPLRKTARPQSRRGPHRHRRRPPPQRVPPRSFMYRCHPQTLELVELIRAGSIGEVRIIQASPSAFIAIRSQPAPVQQRTRRRRHPRRRLLFRLHVPPHRRRGVGKPFPEPERLSVYGQVGPESGVDEKHAAALVVFPVRNRRDSFVRPAPQAGKSGPR